MGFLLFNIMIVYLLLILSEVCNICLELLEYAKQICHLPDEYNQTRTASHELSGFLRVITPDSVCEDMVTANYIDFHNRYPGISLKFTTADTGDMFQIRFCPTLLLKRRLPTVNRDILTSSILVQPFGSSLSTTKINGLQRVWRLYFSISRIMSLAEVK